MVHAVLNPHLYTPAMTMPADLRAMVRGERFDVKRLVVCTEDSVRESDVPQALDNIRELLRLRQSSFRADTFVRPRNLEVLKQLVTRLSGFVIPKTTIEGFPEWMRLIQGRYAGFRVMPILEDPHMYDPAYRKVLLDVLVDPKWRSHIDCVRIGGNDLMGHVAIRRDDEEYTIYDTVVGQLIMSILGEFRGLGGFEVTAPVFECFGPEYDGLFEREVRRSVLNEMFGQTVIHPRHIPLLTRWYAPSEKQVASAHSILDSDVAVNGRDGKMDESATHAKWARRVLLREQLFSIR